YIEMGGRKGLGVKADDLIDRLEADALEEVKRRHPDLAEDTQLATAHSIAVGALRYFLMKFTLNSIIAFDFKEALSFEGETGPYCQYAAVRANSIVRKLDELTVSTGGSDRSSVRTASGSDRIAPDALAEAQDLIDEHELEAKRIFEAESGDEIWSLLMLAGRLEEANAQAATS